MMRHFFFLSSHADLTYPARPRRRPFLSPLLQPLVPSSWARLGPDAVGEPPPQPIPILGATPLKSWGPTWTPKKSGCAHYICFAKYMLK